MSVTTDWYRTFFQGLALDFWQAVTPPTLTQAEISCVLRLLEAGPLPISKASHFLDIPCGYGRHALAMARQGYTVTGVDISPEFLAAAQVQAADLPVRFYQGDVLVLESVLPAGGLYDGAWCLGNSFGYFNHEGMQRFLQGVAVCLKPSARFVIDSAMVAESFLPNFEERIEMEVAGIHWVAENIDYNPGEGSVTARFEWRRGAEYTTAMLKHYIYTVADICRMCEQAGFQTVGLYGDHALKPYGLGDAQLLAVFGNKTL